MTGTFDPEAGAILLVDKPVGWTSFNVVAKLRGALHAICGHLVKVGHAGTLDPLASGLLVLGTGKLTKQLPQLTDEDKAYTAHVRLGQSTPSYDAETEVDRELPWQHLGDDAIHAALRSHTGTILQTPPDFSAKRYRGERAYHLARAGAHVELKAVTVTIHSLDLVAHEGADLTLEVRCSKGTYIRSLAHGIGQALGCGAYLTGLRRTASGAFHVRDARSPEEWSVWLDRWASEHGRRKNAGTGPDPS